MKNLIHTGLFVFAAILITMPASAQKRQRRGDGEGRAHFEQQHAENEAFRKTLKDMEPAEAIAAIKEHRTRQYQENLIFFSAMKDKRADRINNNDRLSDDQKAELISFLEVMYARRVAFFTTVHETTIALLDELAGQEGLTRKDLHSALQEHFEASKEKIEAFRQQQHQAWREKMREIIGERQAKEDK